MSEIAVSVEDPVSDIAGQISLPVIHFEGGIPGFEDCHRFAIVALEPELAPFEKMVCLDRMGLQFFVVSPGFVVPGYQLKVDDADIALLELEDADDVFALVILTLNTPPEPTAANMMGPIVINRRTSKAKQVIQHDSGYSFAEPLVPKT